MIEASLTRLLSNENDRGFRPICGKVTVMRTHLRKCQLVAPETRQLAMNSDLKIYTGEARTVSSSSSLLLGTPSPGLQPSPLLMPGSRQLSPLPSPGLHPASPMIPISGLPSVPEIADRPAKRQKLLGSDAPSWGKEATDEFQHDLCLAFISSGIAWNAISDVQLRHFLAKWIPGAEIPDRRKLAGPILDKEVTRVVSKTRLQIGGQYATGQCDGWKNIAKASVVTSMIVVDFEVSAPINYLMRSHRQHVFYRESFCAHTMSLLKQRMHGTSCNM